MKTVKVGAASWVLQKRSANEFRHILQTEKNPDYVSEDDWNGKLTDSILKDPENQGWTLLGISTDIVEVEVPDDPKNDPEAP